MVEARNIEVEEVEAIEATLTIMGVCWCEGPGCGWLGTGALMAWTREELASLISIASGLFTPTRMPFLYSGCVWYRLG